MNNFHEMTKFQFHEMTVFQFSRDDSESFSRDESLTDTSFMPVAVLRLNVFIRKILAAGHPMKAAASHLKPGAF